MFKCKDCIYHNGDVVTYWGRECTESSNQNKWNHPKWKTTTARYKRDSYPACKKFRLNVILAGGWTQEELVHQYRVAKDKQKQIEVLSDLTGVSRNEIKEILISFGEEVKMSKKRCNRRR